MKINISRKTLIIGFSILMVLSVLVIYLLKLRADTGAYVNGERIQAGPIDKRIEVLKKQDPNRFTGLSGIEEERKIRQSLLEERIALKVTSQNAAKEGVKVADAEIDQRFKTQSQAFGGTAAFKQELENEGLTDYLMRDLLRDQIFADKLRAKVAGDTKVTSAEIGSYLKSNSAQFTDPTPQVKLAVITVDAPKSAETLIDNLRSGMEWSAAAEQYAVNRDATELGWQPESLLDDEIMRAIAPLETGAYSRAPVVNPDNTLSVFRVEERQTRRSAEAEIPTQIERKLLRIKQKKSFNAWFRKVYAQADITKYL